MKGAAAVETGSDEQLVSAVLTGHRSAFAVLVKRYATAVRAVALHVVRDHHLADDVTQETFLSAQQQLANLRVPALFGRWILRIARHQAVRTVRGRRDAVAIDSVAEPVSPDEPIDRDDSEELLAAVMRLPERERRLIMLRYFDGQSVEQIAVFTGRPVGTVTKQLSRGYERLRRQLAEVMS